ncbi:putative F-box domain-containing protein [Medicago truncatula]|uniref:F-box protein interaction domain protein n=1 Tax=Medicago truncatula TaxID=3880 RepID=A0A072V6F7_MEDTR|nr:F-box protein CPR1 [Medicago truncatula]KEH36918.1 F-box protein interaction domain protein [Medicago truncatula]RHN72560.1 putative F-box domain-containing protein [Medicago truncatula]
MADVPTELFIDILSRLPVQSLLRFRSISKSLRSFIDSHTFTKHYLKNSFSIKIILRHNYDLYQLDFSNLTTHVKFSVPLNINLFNPNIDLLGGSCNGLLCISNGVSEIAFWNPNIRKHRVIPYLPIPRNESDFRLSKCVHGFGFDQSACNYKLVRVSFFEGIRHIMFKTQVRLFSSKTNSWKALPNIPYALYSTQPVGVFVENSLHWVVTRNRSQPCLIVAFNLTQEVFNEVPLPEIQMADNVKGFQIDVSLLGECLCMTVNHVSVRHHTTKVEVWVMKKYGFRDSWCKLFTFEDSCFNKPLRSLKPLCYSSDRSKVLLEVKGNLYRDCKKLFWYDLKSEEVTCVQGIPNFNETMIYVGTLLPPSLPIDNYNYIKA